MMQFLKHSQDPVMAEKMGLRGGVGLAAPQLDISKRIIAVLVPNIVEEGETPQEAYDLQAIMTIQKSSLTLFKTLLLVKEKVACLWTVTCLDYVVRHARVTVDYFDKDGEKHLSNLKVITPLFVQHGN